MSYESMNYIYNVDDIRNVLTSLASANHRSLRLAKEHGMDPRVAYLCSILYSGALEDMALAFGLPPSIVVGHEALEVEVAALEKPAPRIEIMNL